MIAFVLVALAYAHWSYLALFGGLPVFGAILVVETGLFVALASGRWTRPLAAGAALLELLGLFLVPIDAVSLAYNLLVVVGLGLLAWRGSLAPGAYVAFAGLGLMLVTDLVQGDTFLLLGLALAAAGWAALSWRAARGARAAAAGA